MGGKINNLLTIIKNYKRKWKENEEEKKKKHL